MLCVLSVPPHSYLRKKMITTSEIVKTLILGVAIVWAFRKLSRPKKWNEIERIVKI
jgi:hypothetical protein